MNRKLYVSTMLFVALTVQLVVKTQVEAQTLVWSSPTRITAPPLVNTAPTISQDSAGRIWVFFTASEVPSDKVQLSYITSTDRGMSWSPPQPFPPASVPPEAIGECCLFEDSLGRLWAAWTYWTAPGKCTIYYSISHDHGNNWSTAHPVVYYHGSGSPHIVEVGGAIWLVFVSWGIELNWEIYYIATSDGGDTWSMPQAVVTGQFRYDTCDAYTDSTGKVYVVYSNLTSAYDPHTSDLWYKATDNSGQTWSSPRQITSFPSEEEDPTILEYSGMLYVFYFNRYSTDILYIASNDGGSTWSSTPMTIPDSTVDQHWLDATVVGNSILVVWQSKMAGGGSYDVWFSKNTVGTKTWIVDDDGTADFHTIQEAVDAANGGDTISVRAGIYHENVVVDKTISLIGEDKSKTIVDGGNVSDTILIVADSVIVSGFTAKNGKGGWPHGGISVRAKSVTITENNASYNYGSGIISSYDGHNNLIFNNIATYNNLEGIRVDGHNSDTLVTGNMVEHNKGDGIFLYTVTGVMLDNNTIQSNQNSGVVIFLDSMNITVKRNLILNNGGDGIFSNQCNNSLFENNSLSRNGFSGVEFVLSNNSVVVGNAVMLNKYGAYVHDSSGDRIYHNNFVNNTVQAVDEKTDTFWDNSYPCGGNYWSDYIGADAFWGINKDLKGSDMIGDTPYIIGGTYNDRYPLMTQWRQSKPPVNEFPDLNGDGLINIVDIATVAKHFGERFEDP